MDLAMQEMADRIRALIGDRPNVREQKMFGGIAFMLNGNMLLGPMKGGGLMVRVGKDAYEDALTRPGAGKMMFTGKEMSGFVEVSGDAVEGEEELAGWISFAEEFVGTLPAK